MCPFTWLCVASKTTTPISLSIVAVLNLQGTWLISIANEETQRIHGSSFPSYEQTSFNNYYLTMISSFHFMKIIVNNQ